METIPRLEVLQSSLESDSKIRDRFRFGALSLSAIAALCSAAIAGLAITALVKHNFAAYTIDIQDVGITGSSVLVASIICMMAHTKIQNSIEELERHRNEARITRDMLNTI